MKKVGTCLQKQKALKTLKKQEGIKALRVYDFPDVFDNAYTDDRRFVTYYVDGVNNWPRLSKSCAEELGDKLLSSMVCIDYDNPRHGHWNRASLKKFYTTLSHIPQEDPLNDYCIFYTTPRGARFVYKLKKPIRYDRHDYLVELIIRRFFAYGIEVDQASKQWSKLWRLPKVFREDDNTNTGDLPFFDKFEQYDVELDTKKITGTLISTGKPPESEVALIIKQCEWGTVKARLKSKKCFDYIFKDEPLGEPGNRTDTIKRFVGQAVNALYGTRGVRPEVIYSLFYNSVSCLTPDETTRDWLQVLWDLIIYTWEEHEKNEENIAPRDLGDLLEKVKEWYPEATSNWLSRRLLLSTDSNNFFIMTKEGQYTDYPIPKGLVRSKIHELDMTEYIQLYRHSGNKVVPTSTQELLETYCKHIKNVIYSPQFSTPKLDDEILQLPVHALNTKLTPQYDERVQEWLLLLGGNKSKQLLEWLAWAVEVKEGAICALAILGAPGIGKKLLPLGLAECFENSKVASEYEFGNFQHNLLETPIVWFDEGIPKNLEKHPADFFRIYVSGGQISINKKYQSLVTLKAALRMILCGNSDDILKPLFDGRSLTPDDMNAISQRILIIRPSTKLEGYFAARGGYEYTRGWIAGDSKDDSQYVIARHILWLNQEAKKVGPPGERFLVDGQSQGSDFQTIVLAQKDYVDAFEILIDLLSKKKLWLDYGVLKRRLDGMFYFMPKGFCNFAKNYHKTKFSFAEVNRYFQSILPDGYKVYPRRVNDSPKRRWYCIDPDKLSRICDDVGLVAPLNILDPKKEVKKLT